MYFVDAEQGEEEFFLQHLDGHDVRFVPNLGDVPNDAELVSLFIGSNVDTAFLEAHPKLRLVATRSHSTEHIDLPACAARHVTVVSVPSYGENTVAEHTFALILALSRRLREVMTLPGHGHFSYEAARGFDLFGKTLGLIGAGRIGRRVAVLAKGFGMEVLAVDPVPDSAMDGILTYVTLPELLARSHVISLHASLTADTYHLIDSATLAQCRRGVLIINTARGTLINTQALRNALESGQVGGAGLDVLQDERVMRQSVSQILSAQIIEHLRSDALASEARDADRLRAMQELMMADAILSRSNVVFTPHVAFNSEEAIQWLREVTLENIRSFLKS